MGTLLLGLAVICALAGGWLVLDYLLWLFTGTVTAGTIETFDKGMPVFTFETPEGKPVKGRAGSIRQISYYLTEPQVGDVFNVIYRDGKEVELRVHGYMYLLAGAVLFLPGIAALAIRQGSGWVGGQVTFMFMFVAIAVGCWALMKVLRRNY